eukprot:1793462-Rhodomonas_salina.2
MCALSRFGYVDRDWAEISSRSTTTTSTSTSTSRASQLGQPVIGDSSLHTLGVGVPMCILLISTQAGLLFQ